MSLAPLVMATFAALIPHHHKHHHHKPKPPIDWQGPVIASWYDDAGNTACGFHSTYGFASLFLPCGERIRMRHGSTTVDAVMQDHGPYVAGRTFDLNPALKAALGCSDLCSVQWAR